MRIRRRKPVFYSKKDNRYLPTLGENRVLGNVSPDFRMGFNTTFEFYKFRLSAVLDWKQGGCIRTVG